MRKILVSSMAIFLFMSCSNDNNSIDENTAAQNEEFAKASRAPQIESNDFTKKLLGNNFIANEGMSISQSNKEKMIADFKAVYNKAPVVHGPFTKVIPVPSPYPINQKVTYTQVGSTYPVSGVYIADIYSYYLKEEIPANAVSAWVNDVNTTGYGNYGTQTIGFSSSMSSENGKKYVIGNTYTMALKYNMVGQLINAVVPAPSGAKTYSYSYLTL